MGSCWSCCRREKSPEKEPLLAKSRSYQPNTSFEKLGDIVGAFNSGKIPSQDQVAGLLQRALRSEFLNDPAPSSGGPLSRRGIALVLGIKELMESVLRVGLEKNYDNVLQDLLYQSTRISDKPMDISGKVLVDGIPVDLNMNTSEEMNADAEHFLKSLKTLARLAVTSSAFRMLLSDILATTREVIAEAASEVAEIASQVQATAADVSKAVELDNLTVEGLKGKAEESYSGIQQSVAHAHRNLGTLGDDSAERVKDIVVGRVQEIAIQAHQSPEHQSSIRTILFLLRKYSGKLSSVAESADQPITIATQVDVSPPLYEAVADFKVILERLASGHSLDPLLRTFKFAVTDILDAPSETGTELKAYFADVSHWAERALAEPKFAASRLGTQTAGELYDAGRLLLASESNSQWAHDIRLLVDQTQAFFHALESDAATQKFIRALHRVTSELRGLAQEAVFSGVNAQHKWREELLKDALGWLVPKVLKSVRSLPMPRVEFQNSSLDVAVDALLLTSSSTDSSLTPDHIWVQNWSEVRVDMTSESPAETSSKTRLHIDGMRCSAHGFGYYFRYKRPVWYADEGVLDVDVGSPTNRSQGLTVDLELETTHDSRETPGEPLFRLVDVNVSIHGLKFAIKHSKHWIINGILQPLIGPLVSMVLKSAVEQQVRLAFDSVEKTLSAVLEEASRVHERRGKSGDTPTLEDYCAAFLSKSPSMFQKDEQLAPPVETHTTPTLKGIIHTTTTIPDATASSSSRAPQESETTVLAVGGGAQLFPNKGGPYGVDEVTVGDVAHEVVEEVQETLERSVNKTQEIVETVGEESVRIRDDLERAEERKNEREQLERRRKGWRSHAFDFA
ncbi:hypothetical protein C8J57DRAFT_1714793 [Mycena rebaudengoi]|nr:hypothetical protein C8J57DRAFT_1714793 [Mycena rebaudengoi]